MFWPSRELIGSFLLDIQPLVHCVESYLGLQPMLLPYYSMEAFLTARTLQGMLTLDCSPHAIYIRRVSPYDSKLLLRSQQSHLSVQGVNVAAKEEVELEQDSLKFRVKIPYEEDGYLCAFMDTDGMLRVSWCRSKDMHGRFPSHEMQPLYPFLTGY